MRRRLAALVVLPLALAACGGGSASSSGAAASPASKGEAGSPATEPVSSTFPTEDSAATIATVPPSCEDPTGDSKGPLDLTLLTIAKTPDEVLFIYEYEGSVPMSGSVLFVSSDGLKQYGYKLVDGQESAHFVFDFSTAQQENVDLAAEVEATEARVSFAVRAVDIAKLAGGTATISVEGTDVDECTLS